MTVTLVDAIRAVDERKEAAFGEEDLTGGVTLDEVMRLAVGFDLEPEEVQQTAMAALLVFAQDVASGNDPAAAVKGTFINGLLAGLLLADMRSREAVES